LGRVRTRHAAYFPLSPLHSEDNAMDVDEAPVKSTTAINEDDLAQYNLDDYDNEPENDCKSPSLSKY
jgi:hypothetical protein